MMTVLFSVTLFVSALLLFSVQPMMGKMLLPVFGGAPAVWQTVLVFFQAMLLGGYAYAHWTSRCLRPRSRVLLHVILIAVAGAFLPLSLDGVPVSASMTSEHQAWHLLSVLLRVVGLPFLILSSTSPLLQRWFSTSGHATARDPYYLSVASNIGSFVALFAFPVLVEPQWTLRTASAGWAAGYALLLPLVLASAVASGQWGMGPPGSAAASGTASSSGEEVRLAWGRRFRWMAAAAVPSSLMLGLTTFVTTEVASIPLLGILPLGLYLATFILAFARRRWLPSRGLARVLPFAAICLAFQIFTEATHPIGVIVGLHLVFFFVAALLCHTRLADDRPSPEFLTEFYLWMSVGGVLGGLFNALVAPVLFSSVVEYPLAIVLVCFFRPSGGRAASVRDLAVAAGVGAGMWALIRLMDGGGWLEPYPRRILLFAAGALLSVVFLDRPVRFGLCLGALFLSTAAMDSLHGRTLHLERNFFGVSRVTQDPDGRSHRLVHGNTIHGRQFFTPSPSCEPLTYFHHSGPLGRIFRAYEASKALPRVAITGLGCGAIAGYARPGQIWDYYEIDPAVIGIAGNTNLFTFLGVCAQAPVRIVAGDARLRLREAADGGYGLLIMDAFTSDSIPLHLLTREALALYLGKLEPRGLLAINISNRYLDLTPVVASLAADAGLAGYHWEDPYEEKDVGKEPSHWAVLARSVAGLDAFRRDPRWKPLVATPGARPWTDDFSNVLRVMKWGGGD
jgi:hypothetical protein